MGDWKEYKLEEIVLFQRGHDLPKAKMNEGKYPVAGSNGIIGYHNNFTTKGPGVTIGRSGNIGNPSYYKNDYWAHNTVLYVKEFRNAYPKFIYYFLLTLDFTQFNAGSAVPTLNRNHIHDLRWKFPEIPEQQSIASILSSLDDKIDLLYRQNKTLEALAETLFRQWFPPSQVLRRTGVEEADESWEEKSLEELVDFNPKEKVDLKKEYTFFEMNCLSNDSMSMKDGIKRIVKSGSNFRNTDVLLAKITPCLENGKTGLVTNLKEDEVGRGSTEFVVMRAKKNISPYWVYCLSRDESFRDIAILSMTGTSGRQRVQVEVLKDYEVRFKQEIMIEFHKKVTLYFEKVKSNQIQIRTLTQLRDTLLPKLMSGEVRADWKSSSLTSKEIDTKPIYTIGHSNHSIEKFISLLKRNKINVIADVRSTPFSRHNPHFNQKELKESLGKAGTKYLFMGKELGGRPNGTEYYNEGTVDYKKVAEREEFKNGIERLLKGREDYNIALMCSEKDPLNCHRMLLVGKELVKLKIPVKHILADGKVETNKEAEQRLLEVEGMKQTLFNSGTDDNERIAEAYKKRSSEVGYRIVSEKNGKSYDQ